MLYLDYLSKTDVYVSLAKHLVIALGGIILMSTFINICIMYQNYKKMDISELNIYASILLFT